MDVLILQLPAFWRRFLGCNVKSVPDQSQFGQRTDQTLNRPGRSLRKIPVFCKEKAAMLTSQRRFRGSPLLLQKCTKSFANSSRTVQKREVDQLLARPGLLQRTSALKYKDEEKAAMLTLRQW